MTGRACVLQEKWRSAKVIDDNIEIAIAIEIGHRRAETNATLIHSPLFATFFHLQAAAISKSAIRLIEWWLRVPEVIVTIPSIF